MKVSMSAWAISLIMAGLSSLIATQESWAFGRSRNAPLETVPSVDLTRYSGLWYEIGRLPQRFEKGCAGVTAEYSPRSDGKIDVKNTCRQGSLDGEVRVADGVARVVDESQAKLKVSFFWPFEGDYWILELEENYRYAVVGSPDRKSLWILSREPRMNKDLVGQILERRIAQGFDVAPMEWTEQP